MKKHGIVTSAPSNQAGSFKRSFEPGQLPDRKDTSWPRSYRTSSGADRREAESTPTTKAEHTPGTAESPSIQRRSHKERSAISSPPQAPTGQTSQTRKESPGQHAQPQTPSRTDSAAPSSSAARERTSAATPGSSRWARPSSRIPPSTQARRLPSPPPQSWPPRRISSSSPSLRP